MSTLPFNPSETYRALEPGDLDPHPAPTPEQRVRVAAALTTWVRDQGVFGVPCNINAEVLRAILTMDAAAWARDIHEVREAFAEFNRPLSYDPVDPKVRWEEVVRASKAGEDKRRRDREN